MRLLNISTQRLETFFGDDIPPYAILSHTWEKEEILFEDIFNPELPLPSQKGGWQKLQYTCEQAMKDGFTWVWIDTCCIDKSSSAELSEAINSMFKWYQLADICYAYLSDIDRLEGNMSTELQHSRWFTRGWTLQELIAPPEVRFYDRNWRFITTRQAQDECTASIFQGSMLPKEVLCRCLLTDTQCTKFAVPGPQGYVIGGFTGLHSIRNGRCVNCAENANPLDFLETFSIAERMSWAANRRTTRAEDQAYCLLGVFGINMPMLYGEGQQAFTRLQEEILKISDDQSILAFERTSSASSDFVLPGSDSALADSPLLFSHSEIIRTPKLNCGPVEQYISPSITARGKIIETRMVLCPLHRGYGQWREGVGFLGILDCSYRSDLLARPAIVLAAVGSEGNAFRRVFAYDLVKVTPALSGSAASRTGIMRQGYNGTTGYKYDLRESFFQDVRIFLTPNTNATMSSSYVIPGLQILVPSPWIATVRAFPHELDDLRELRDLSETKWIGYYAPSLFMPDIIRPSMLSDGICGMIFVSGNVDEPFFILWGMQNIERAQGAWCRILPISIAASHGDLHAFVNFEHLVREFMYDLLSREKSFCDEAWGKIRPDGVQMKSVTDRMPCSNQSGRFHEVKISDTSFVGQCLVQLKIDPVYQLVV